MKINYNKQIIINTKLAIHSQPVDNKDKSFMQ